MLRILLAGALGALLALPAPAMGGQTIATPSTENPIFGRAFGAWDLPRDAETGQVTGLLVDVGGRRLALDAKLFPAPMRRDLNTGRLVGALSEIDSSGERVRQVADIVGSYLGGADGFGKFEVTILTRDPRPIERIGRIVGRFADPLVNDKDPIGRFVGRWALR